MKRLMLGMVVTTGLVVAMANQSLATTVMSCDVEEAIAEAKAVIAEIGTMKYAWTDAKGVSISEHVAYLEKKIAMAEGAVASGYAADPEELYATVTEGTRALELITGTMKGVAQQTAAPKTTTQPATQTVVAKAVDQVQNNIQTEKVEKSEKIAEAPKVAQVVQTPQAKLAVAKIETAVPTNGARLASVDVSARVAGPEETAGLEQEIEVPATGEVDTGELERILMTIGVASAVGMLGLAGICAIIGRR